jgi:hypothetical protein
VLYEGRLAMNQLRFGRNLLRFALRFSICRGVAGAGIEPARQ